jgi:hypothetical protein
MEGGKKEWQSPPGCPVGLVFRHFFSRHNLKPFQGLTSPPSLPPSLPPSPQGPPAQPGGPRLP